MRQEFKAWFPGGLVLAALSSWAIWETLADVPAPVLRATQVSTNQVNVLITNGVSTATYELYWTPSLNDPLYPWTLLTVGTTGQTNFGVLMNSTTIGFIEAVIGTDQDGDGVPDFKDARPNDPAVGVLTVTIESPSNGSTIN